MKKEGREKGKKVRKKVSKEK